MNIDEDLINNFNKLVVYDNTYERNILMKKMLLVDNLYGGLFEELYGILEEFVLYDDDRIFNSLKLDEILYDMIDYYSTDYLNYINSFIQFMKENVSNNIKISDVLFCIKNY
jgi:hypothetical protein